MDKLNLNESTVVLYLHLLLKKWTLLPSATNIQSWSLTNN